MIFNLGNQYEIEKYKEYVNTLYKEKAVVEVKKKRANRTLKQNSYLHVIIQYFASEYGCSAEEAKLDFYKKRCNKDLFLIEKVNKYGKKVTTVKSSSLLNTEEMSLSIERFRNYSSSVAGIYLPSANENDFLLHCEQIIEQNKEFI